MKKWIIRIAVLLISFSLLLIAFIMGLFSGMTLEESKANLDTQRLSKVINSIDAYYQENNKYPTTPAFYYNESNCELNLEHVNSEMVSFYCGQAGRNNYHVKFTENGNVDISRR